MYLLRFPRRVYTAWGRARSAFRRDVDDDGFVNSLAAGIERVESTTHALVRIEDTLARLIARHEA
jgi:hypothetical protein